MVACGDADGEPTVVAWSRALAHAVPLSRVHRLPVVSPWDETSSSRCVDAEAIRVLPVPPPPWQITGYPGRRNVEPPPLRPGVGGDLAAALREVGDAPQWVGAEERLERVRRVIETPGSTRAQMLAAVRG